MEPREIAGELLKIGLEFSNKIDTKIPAGIAENESSPEKEAFLFFYFKVRKTYKAIVLLWNQGYPEDAFVLTRTLFEISLQARYILQDPQSRSERFIRFDPVRRWRHFEKLRKSGDKNFLQELTKNPKMLEKLKHNHDESMKNFCYPETSQNWWGKSIEWLAKHLGNGTDPIYFGLYPIQSGHVHSDIRSSKAYLKIDGGNLVFNDSSNLGNSIVVPMEATRNLIIVASCFVNIFDLKLDNEISSAIDQVRKLSGIV